MDSPVSFSARAFMWRNSSVYSASGRKLRSPTRRGKSSPRWRLNSLRKFWGLCLRLFIAAWPTSMPPPSSMNTAEGREYLLPNMLAPVLMSTGWALPSGPRMQMLE